MKALVADTFPEAGLEALRQQGAEVLYAPELVDQALVDALILQRPEVLVVRSTRVTSAMLETEELGLVVRAGAGFNTIDVEAASRRGILVANCPGKNSTAVAELAFGLMLALDRRITENTVDLRRGVWNKKEYSKARGLFGRTLGIVGLGRIGQEMVTRARAFGMPVVAWSRSLTEARASELGVHMVSSPLELAETADIVSIHLASNEDTQGLIGAEFFGRMRSGALFVNTSRAEVVDETALAQAVREEGLRAGLDVFTGEPKTGKGEVASPLFQLEGVIGSHHIGASTEQAQEAIADETVRIVREYMSTRHAPNTVNLAKKTPATHLLVVTHYDRVGALAGILDQVREAGVNVEEMENVVFQGAVAAVARIQLSKALSKKVLEIMAADKEKVIALHLVTL
jgi:D-3-phosphoglycerate dehydrogenase / 2-oxoglutarate reductase